jgi:hypothetical protein
MREEMQDGVRVIHLEKSDKIDEKEANSLEGHHLDLEDYTHTVVEGDADVYKPNGEPLVRFRKGVIPQEKCDDAREGLKDAASETDNRGAAAGQLDLDKFPESYAERIKGNLVDKGEFRATYKTSSGKKRNVANPVNSGVVGYYDSYPRIPYCRTTAYTRDHFEDYQKAVPFIQEVSDWFRKLIPDRWEVQKKQIENTTDAFVIDETVFTTVTVNKNFRTAVHTDAGDLKEGFGNLTVLENGDYEGGVTFFPEFGVGVDCREQDFLGMDVHEWHCNSELNHIDEDFERISVVCYYRTGMSDCGPKEREEKKKERRQQELEGEDPYSKNSILDQFS